MHLNEAIMRMHAEGLHYREIHQRIWSDPDIDDRYMLGANKYRGPIMPGMVRYIIRYNSGVPNKSNKRKVAAWTGDPMTLDEIYLKLATAKSLFYLEEASKLASEIQRHFPEYVDADAKHALSTALWMGSATTGVWPSVGAAIEFGLKMTRAIDGGSFNIQMNPGIAFASIPLGVIAGAILDMVLVKHGTDECERLGNLPLLSKQEHIH